MSAAAVPVEGTSYQDDDGRVLLVKRVRETDPLGREVVGLLYQPTSGPMGLKGLEGGEPFSTSLAIFGFIWRDRGLPSVADAIAPEVPEVSMDGPWCGTPGLMEMQRRRREQEPNVT